MSDVCIKANSYCPVCRGIGGVDHWHEASKFNAGSGYVRELEQLRTQLSELQAKNARKNADIADWSQRYAEKCNQLTVMQLYAKGLKDAMQIWLDENEDHGPCQCDSGCYGLPGDSYPPSQCASCNWNSRINPLQQALNSTSPDLSAVEELVRDAEKPIKYFLLEHESKFMQLAGTIGDKPYAHIEWVDYADHAFRFYSREQALLFVGMWRELSGNLPYKHTIQWLRPDDRIPAICEHMDIISIDAALLAAHQKEGGE